MKRIGALVIALLLMLLPLTVGQAEHPDGTLTYTNLVGKAVQAEVGARLAAGGIAQERIDRLMLWVDDFNQAMAVCPTFDLKDEFTVITARGVDYGDYYPMSTAWFKTNKRDYGDVLCRIAAFELMQDHITVGACLPREKWACQDDTQWLFSDGDAIFNAPLMDFSEADIERYFTLYQPVEMEAGCNAQAMAEAIAEAWTLRGVEIREDGALLLTIWTQSEGKTAVAHAAVLVSDDEGFLLVEKTNPQSPYQATLFDAQEQAVRYMLDAIRLENERYDMETGPCVVMKNATPVLYYNTKEDAP